MGLKVPERQEVCHYDGGEQTGRHGTGAVAKVVESSPGIQEASETLHPPQ